jgi:hypothetical protein
VACSLACCPAALARAHGASQCSASSRLDSARGDWQAPLAGLVSVEPSPQSDELEAAGALLAREELPGIHLAAAREGAPKGHAPMLFHEPVDFQS